MSKDKLEVRLDFDKEIKTREGEVLVSIPTANDVNYIAYFSGSLVSDRTVYERAVNDLRATLVMLSGDSRKNLKLTEIKFTYERD